MKYGICIPGNFTMPDSPAAGMTEQLRALVDGYRFVQEAGYDYQDHSVGNLMVLSDEDFAKAAAFHDRGLCTVEACTGFIPGSLPLVGDSVDLQAVEAYLHKALGRMAALGVEVVVFGSGGARRKPEGVSDEQASRQLDEFMILAESVARPLGITIVIEPLNHKETNTFLTVTESARAVRRLNLPNLKLLADFYHTYVENEDPQVIRDNGDILRHTHVADPEDRVCPVDHPYLRACGQALRDVDYQGRISIECRWTDLKAEAVKALPLMKELF